MSNLTRLLPSRRVTVERDEFGASEDGGLAIIDGAGTTIHITPPRVAAALRYLLARQHSLGGNQFPDRITITSALHGEGVTYVARSLASLLAYDTEANVVLVDLNWKTPAKEQTKKRRLGKKASREPAEASGPTLADAVENEVDTAEIIQATANPRLSLVTAGVLPLARRPGAAGSRALEQVIEELASKFDHVLLDIPPVLASSDAIKLAQLGDAYILVILQGITSERHVDAALDQLEGNESLGVVLNRVDSKVPNVLRRLVEV